MSTKRNVKREIIEAKRVWLKVPRKSCDNR
jgi:hypothetical protein